MTPCLHRLATSGVFTDSRLHGFADSRFQVFTGSRLESFADSRFQIFTGSRLQGFAGSRFQIFIESTTLKTHFMNFVKLDISRLTGFS
jgi:hypothetical protein